MRSAHRPPPGYPHGYSRRKKPRSSSRKATTLRRTSFMPYIDVPFTPNPDQNNVNKKLRTLILVEVGFYKDLGCDTKLTEKTEKYFPFVVALKKYWGRVEIVAIPIRHTGTTLQRTLEHSQPHSPLSALTWSKQEPARASSTATRTPTPGATTIACSSRYWPRSRTWRSPTFWVYLETKSV